MSRATVKNSNKFDDSLADKIATIRENNARLENRHREIELDKQSALDNGNSIMPSQIRVTIYRPDISDNIPQTFHPNHSGFKKNFRKSGIQGRGGYFGKQYSTSMSRLPQKAADCGVEDFSHHPPQQNLRSGQLRSRRRGGGGGGGQNGVGQMPNVDIRHVVISEPPLRRSPPPHQQQLYQPQNRSSKHTNLPRNSAANKYRNYQNDVQKDYHHQDVPPRHYNEAKSNYINSTKSMSSLDAIPDDINGGVGFGGYGTVRFASNSSRGDNQTNWKSSRRGVYNVGNFESHQSSHQPYSKRQYQVPPRFRNRIYQAHPLNLNNYQNPQPPQQVIQISADETSNCRECCGDISSSSSSSNNNKNNNKMFPKRESQKLSSSMKLEQQKCCNKTAPTGFWTSSASTRDNTDPWVRGNVIRGKGGQQKQDSTVLSSKDLQSPVAVTVKTVTESTSTPSSPTSRFKLPTENDFLVFDDEYIDDNPLDDLDQFTLKIDIDGGFIVHDASITHPMLAKPIRSWIDYDSDDNAGDKGESAAIQHEPCRPHVNECSLSSSGVSTLSSRRMSTGDISTTTTHFALRQTVSLDCIDKVLISCDMDSSVQQEKLLYSTLLEANYFQLVWE